MPEPLTDRLQRVATPLVADGGLDPLIDRIDDARIVMPGEASHGTSEYYTWRDRMTRRPILEKGFSFIGVERDWPARIPGPVTRDLRSPMTAPVLV